MKISKTIILISAALLVSSNVLCAPSDMYVTTTGAGDTSGDSWANAMDWDAFEADVDGACEPGDRYFVMEGYYSNDGALSDYTGGTAQNPIEIIGVKSGTTAEPPTSADWAYGTARPYFYSCYAGVDTFLNQAVG